jgi:hypothetical protein
MYQKSILAMMAIILSACGGGSGSNGDNGTGGADGSSGISGIDGTDGINGTDGADGADGADAKIPLSIVVADVSANENTSSVTFSIQLTESQSEIINITYGTIDVTAESGQDYTATAGTLEFAVGETEKSVTVQLLNDTAYECDQYFLLQLNSIGGNYSAFARLSDDGDTPPALNFSTSSSDVLENAGSTTINVQLAQASCQDATIDIIYGGDATRGDDYQELSEFVIPAGATQASFDLNIIDDEITEERERITLSLSSSDEVTANDQTHSLSILPVSDRIVGGYYGNCVMTQDGLTKCFGYNGGYNFANGHSRDLGDSYGELSSTITVCNTETETAMLVLTDYAIGNGISCDSYGGFLADHGVDANGNGILDDDEKERQRESCHTSTQKYLYQQYEATTAQCENGGIVFRYGRDENGDEIAQTSEMGEYLIASDIGDSRDIITLGLGESHSCALFNNQQVKCWGSNSSGKLGLGVLNTDVNTYIGDDSAELGDALQAVNFGAGRSAKALTVSDSYNCAILDNDTLKCWGNNSNGKLGYGDTESRGGSAATIGDNLLAVDLGKDTEGQTYTVLQVAAGYDHTCVIVHDGNVKCWGSNNYGELGYDDDKSRGSDAIDMGENLPVVDLGTGRSATKIATGYRSSCAVLDDQSLKCWGYNGDGQAGQGHNDRYLGDGGIENSYNYCNAEGEDQKSRRIEFDPSGNCAEGGFYIEVGNDDDGSSILDDLEVDHQREYCNNPAPALQTMAYLQEVIAGSAECEFGGIILHTGADHGGDNLPGNEMGDALPAIDLGTNLVIKDINQSYYNTCVQYVDDSFKCWGDDRYAGIGLELDTNWGDDPGETPAALDGSADFGNQRTLVQMAGRGYQNCALLDNHDVKCRGYSEYGEVGDPDFYDDTLGDGSPGPEMGDNLKPVSLY